MFLLYWIFNGFFVMSFWLGLVGFLLLMLKWIGLFMFFWLVLFCFVFMLKLEFFEWLKFMWVGFEFVEFMLGFWGGICVEELVLLVCCVWDLLWLLLLDVSFFCSVLSLLVCGKLVFVCNGGVVFLIDLFVVILKFLWFEKL